MTFVRKAKLSNFQSSLDIQFDADDADIDNKAPRAGGVELAPQIADLDVDHIRLRHEVEISHILEQHRPGHDRPRSAHEIFEQGEFSRQEDGRSLAVRGESPRRGRALFDDQNRSGGKSVRWRSRRPVTFCYVSESMSCRLLAFI
jgi:hypothetical protein